MPTRRSLGRRTLTTLPLFAMALAPVCPGAAISQPDVRPVYAAHYEIVQRAESQSSWPQLGFDSGHSGFNHDEHIIDGGNVSQLKLAWKVSTGDPFGVGDLVEDGGVVYAATKHGKIVALRTKDGKLLWTFYTGVVYTTAIPSPAVAKGMVFALCALRGKSQGLCAIDTRIGKVVWSYSAGGKAGFPGTPPTLAEGFVFFGTCGSTCAYVALQQWNGMPAWLIAESSECAPNNGVAPAVAAGLFIATTGCSANVLSSWSAKTGDPAWTFGQVGLVEGIAASGNVGSLTAIQGTIAHAWTFAPKTGRQFWHQYGFHTSPLPGRPALAYGTAYVPIGDELVPYRAKTRLPRFIFEQFSGSEEAAVANGVLYILQSGFLAAYSASTGAGLWQPLELTKASIGAPIVVNGVVYSACDGIAVCAWTLPSMRRSR